jgi:osmotically-inducible protein OsmY
MKTFIPRSITPVLAALLIPLSACAGEPTEPDHPATPSSQRITDAWIDARLETAYLFNPSLDSFRIDTDVVNGAVVLSGTVESDLERDLAGELAESLNGVVSVDNRLDVNTTGEVAEVRGESESFVEKVTDATMTARVKSQLIANPNLAGLAIDVDTSESIVTLSGDVGSEAERELAGLIATNTPDVAGVANELRVQTNSESG